MEYRGAGGLRENARSDRVKLGFDAILIGAPALMLALIAIPYRYDVTLAERDLVRMMAAMVYGNATGANEAAGMHYGINFSFAYYKLLYAIAPHDWLRSPDLAARLINGFGIASGLLCALACALYLRMIFGITVAAATTAMFFLSPVALPVALSGHPLMGAAACLFSAGCLLAKSEEIDNGWPMWAALGAALVLLIFGLSLRAEIVLAFPFLWLARNTRAGGKKGPWSVYGCRALVLLAAFVVFLVLQRNYVSAEGGAIATLGSFLQHFMSASRMSRGAAVLALSTGAATLLAILIAILKPSPLQSRFYLPLVLAVPALALWLPNPQPARHFFFTVLAACLFVALWLVGRQGHPKRVLAICILIVLANQLIAEVARPIVVSGYAWSYPLLTERRAIQHVPLGAFPLDQPANQALADVQRREAALLAQQAPERLLILADAQNYLIAHFIAADNALKWSETRWAGVPITQLESADRSITLVQRYSAWPRDVIGEILDAQRWREWPIYVQPSTVSRFDKAAVPEERSYRLLAP
jgi:hypothetical protein